MKGVGRSYARQDRRQDSVEQRWHPGGDLDGPREERGHLVEKNDGLTPVPEEMEIGESSKFQFNLPPLDSRMVVKRRKKKQKQVG